MSIPDSRAEAAATRSRVDIRNRSGDQLAGSVATMSCPELPITTERLILRAFGEHDLAAFHEYRRRADVARYLYWAPRTLEEDRVALRQRMSGGPLRHSGDFLGLAVERTDTGALIGDLVLILASAEHRRGEIGFVFHPAHHGHGFATEAARALLPLGFEELGLHRIVARCDARNDPSAAVMRRLGMRQEAHLRQNEFVKGEWTDELVYALLADEWRGRPVVS
jgi:RimJ/RimL family protein N-acetyltransferase